MMKINHISYSFVLYLALVEGLALFVLDKFPNYGGFFVGFIPALIVLIVYRIKEKYLPVKINKQKVTNVPIVIPSILNGFFIMFLFFVQTFIPTYSNFWYQAILGFVSVFAAFAILIFGYNLKKPTVSFILGKKKILISKVPYMFALYGGLFEFFILPLMFVFYQLNLNVFANGFLAGLIGGTIGLLITNKILKKRPLLF